MKGNATHDFNDVELSDEEIKYIELSMYRYDTPSEFKKEVLKPIQNGYLSKEATEEALRDLEVQDICYHAWRTLISALSSRPSKNVLALLDEADVQHGKIIDPTLTADKLMQDLLDEIHERGDIVLPFKDEK